MIELVVITFGLTFIIAQGAAVFLTAWLAHRYLNLSGVGWKWLLMLLSFFAWIIGTGIGYSLLGGEWGLMDGGMMILSLFTSAAVSSIVYVVGWSIAPLIAKGKAHG